MQNKRIFMLRLLLNRYHAGSLKTLLAPMPEKEAKQILEMSLSAKDPLPLFTAPLSILQKIHYSWLLPKLQSIPKNHATFLIALLSDTQALKLQQMLSLPKTSLQISPKLKKFLAKKWLSPLTFDEALPIEYLPSSELNSLAQLSKQELMELIDFLSLYDLAQEVQNIVDKKILETVYNCLSPKKLAYLKQCMRVKEKLASPKLNLELWDGNCEKLIKLLHHRGIVRLGYALSGQHPDFLWHITHILDSGRGEKLKRFIQNKEIPGVTFFLKKQTLNTVQFLTKVRAS